MNTSNLTNHLVGFVMFTCAKLILNINMQETLNRFGIKRKLYIAATQSFAFLIILSLVVLIGVQPRSVHASSRKFKTCNRAA
jgi:hypothetical protein